MGNAGTGVCKITAIIPSDIVCPLKRERGCLHAGRWQAADCRAGEAGGLGCPDSNYSS